MKVKNTKYSFFLLGLALTDAFLFRASFLTVYFLRHRYFSFDWSQFFSWTPFFGKIPHSDLYLFPAYARISWLFTFLLLIIFNNLGLYRMRRGEEALDEFYNIFKAVALGTLILTGFTFLVNEISYSRFVVFTAGPLAFLAVAVWRTLLWAFVGFMYKKGHGLNHVLIYGAGSAGRILLEELRNHGEFGYRVFGFIDDDPAKAGLEIDGVRVLGRGDELPAITEQYRIDEIFLAFPSADRRKISEVLIQFQNSRINIKIMPDLFDIVTSRVKAEKIGNIPLLSFDEDPLQGWAGGLKRGIDIIGSGLGLLALSPLFLAIAAIIKITSPGPVFFVQDRLGRNGRIFKVFKFRTMIRDAHRMKEKLSGLNEASGPLFKIKNDPRLTPTGKFLRRTSIDELPQLINVFLGQMSLVGPRPPLPEEVARYQPWQKKRLQITPGITGLWQIRGRSLLPFEEMVTLDIYYIENWSLWLDIKILLKTIFAVVSGRGAY